MKQRRAPQKNAKPTLLNTGVAPDDKIFAHI